jgi:hypothetical protein
MRLLVKPGKPPVLEAINHNDHWTLTRGKPEAAVPLPPQAQRILTTARTHETQVRATTLKQTHERRERVAAWMTERSKSSEPVAAKALLAKAAELRTPAPDAASAKIRRNAGSLRGKIYTDSKNRTWEFLSDGTLKCRGVSWGTWEWAKAAEDTGIVIYTGGTGKTESPMLVHVSADSPDTLHFHGFDESFDAKVKM